MIGDNVDQENYDNLNLVQERDNLRQQVANLTNELNRRANISVEDYNQLLASHGEAINERDNLRQIANTYNDLENQKITELVIDLKLINEQ